MNVLVLAAALLFPQQQVARPPADTAALAASRQAISQVGFSVAEVRSALELFRRAVFNGTLPETVERAQVLQRRCSELETSVRAARAVICPRCFRPSAQPSVDRYRGGLPDVAQLGTRCAGLVARRLRADPTGGAVKRDVRTVTQMIVAGLQPYEDRVHALRVALGLEAPSQPAAPARRPRR